MMDSAFVDEELARWSYAVVMTVWPHADHFLKLQREGMEKDRGWDIL